MPSEKYYEVILVLYVFYSKLYVTNPFNHSVPLRNISDTIKYIQKTVHQISGKLKVMVHRLCRGSAP